MTRHTSGQLKQGHRLLLPLHRHSAAAHRRRHTRFFGLQVLRKLEASLAEGQFYEAHEQCKTVYHRLRARRQAEDSYTLCTVRRRFYRLPGCCSVL